MVVPVIPKNTVEAVRYKTCFMLFAFGLMAKLANFYLLRNKACLIFEVNCLILHDTCQYGCKGYGFVVLRMRVSSEKPFDLPMLHYSEQVGSLR